MYEIDKAALGALIAEQRKQKGFTQKALAEKLFISDKAVSKWERGLSVPDISLLIPLSEVLEISVAELLEGRRTDVATGADAGDVENLIRKAVTFSEESSDGRRANRRKNLLIFGGCVLLAMAELIVGVWLLNGMGKEAFSTGLPVLELLSLISGGWFFFGVKERLPSYYDENKISAYSDGPFRMNMPGIYFNNRNWPHIIKSIRIWSMVTLVTIPVIRLLCSAWLTEPMWTAMANYGVLAAYLGGLFVPVYVAGKRFP